MIRHRSGRLAIGVLAALLVATAACGDDDGDADGESGTADSDRPTITVTLGDGSLSLPAEIPGGIVDVVLEAADGEQPHHIVFARLHDGVTYDQLAAAGDDEFFGLVSLQGGNGNLAPGDEARLTLDLPPGDYQVLDLPNGEVAAAAPTVAAAPEDDATEPDARGTISLGPGFTYDVPGDFDGSGTWAFDNADDDVPHEAILFALEDGASVQDVVEWATTFAGPPPGELFSGFGALSGGERGWADLGDELPAGDYALVCLLPGPDGTTHAAGGMAAGFTVD